MIIANFKNLSRNALRKKALLIAEAGYEAIDIEKAVKDRCRLLNIKGNNFLSVKISGKEKKINLFGFRRIFIVGVGKGSALASVSLAKILGEKLTSGIALDVQKPKLKIRNLKLEIFTGTHPQPSIRNIKTTRQIIQLAKSLRKDDLLLMFVCGGGSSLLCGSEEEMRHSRVIFQGLTQSGAGIVELNTVRKHLSLVKGGGLAELVYPASVVSLIVSDVLGNDLSMIASGPNVYDKTSKRDAEKIIKKYLPDSSQRTELIRSLTETPKDKKYFRKVKNFLFFDNKDVLTAMSNKAAQLGFKTKIYSFNLQGEAKDVLKVITDKIKSGEAILAGGETTVTLKTVIAKGNEGHHRETRSVGRGGRNQESVLGALARLTTDSRRKKKNLLFMSFASDGRDNTNAAGAIGDALTLKKSEKLNLDPQIYLRDHNSFNFFRKTEDLIYARPRCFNVADLMIVLSAPPKRHRA